MGKWAIKPSEFDLDFKPPATIKAQALADLISGATGEDPAPECDTQAEI